MRNLAAPRFEDHPQRLIAGLRLRKLGNPALEIPALWQRFAPHIGRVPGQVPGVAYGLCLRGEGSDCATDYIAGCEVANFDGIDADWSRATIPAQRYAIFEHAGAASQLQDSVREIFEEWLPQSGCRVEPAGTGEVGFFERYGPGFDPHAVAAISSCGCQ